MPVNSMPLEKLTCQNVIHEPIYDFLGIGVRARGAAAPPVGQLKHFSGRASVGKKSQDMDIVIDTFGRKSRDTYFF
jgi:hypothetical protein